MNPLSLLNAALDQVAHLQDHVRQAVVPGAGASAVQHLEDAHQSVQGLQQLSAQLQQLAAAVQRATPPVVQPGPNDSTAWAGGIQEQAKQALASLQHELQLGVCRPSRSLLGGTPTPSGQCLADLMQRVVSAVPQLQLHLFSSFELKLLYSHVRADRPPDVASISRLLPFIGEVRVVCQGVFVAAIALTAPGQLQPVRVCVDSGDKASAVDPWMISKHQVFKRISQLTVRALLHFQQLEAAHALVAPGAAGVALEALLLWLGSYDDLFERPCDVTGTVITWTPATAMPLPPIVRPYWLSLEGLREAASNRAARRAYHSHVAPWPRPGQPQATDSAAAPVAAVVTAAGSTHKQDSRRLSDAGEAGAASGLDPLKPWDAVQLTDDDLRRSCVT